MRDVIVYKCFIASPGDTKAERDICDRVFKEINETQGEQYGFRIESKKWEKDARPGFGESPQDVINKQLLDDIQLFIGIMFTRFGMPTDKAESGTEEEFNIAYERKDDIEIMFYFNTKEIRPDQIDTEQLSKVNAFKNKITRCGGLYTKYTGEDDFERKLKRHLHDYFKDIVEKESQENNGVISEKLASVFNDRLNESLSIFSNQPDVWVEPILYKPKKSQAKTEEKEKVDIDDIVDSPYSVMIKAPPQFGLSCLSHYLIKKAWEKNKLWIYLDMSAINIQIDIDKLVNKELKKIDSCGADFECVVLDSWQSSLTGAMKILRGLCNRFPDKPIIVMNTIGDFMPPSDHNIKIDREFKELSLSALPRNSIRQVVSKYNIKKNIGDEDIVLEKVIKDMDILNIHRTPLNCITLLKISEKHFDESPVNRTKMIEMFLFVLFDLVELPTYRTKPDVKDCEHVLGYFCEILIKERRCDFSRDEFINTLSGFCEQKLLDLEVAVVFDVLLQNRIIVACGNKYRFRATYWIYYFSANQMHVNKDFYDYVMTNDIYTNFPEIIEFYTGIDRNSQDMISVLTDDLSRQCDVVEKKTGLTIDFNPLEAMEWNPSTEQINEAKRQINSEVLNSNLPSVLKDEYADKGYSYERPYYQEIGDILEEYTFLVLKQKIRASSRALRNSDYIDPDEKKKLLKQITRGWLLFSKILFVLAPVMAKDDYASFDGLSFVLFGFDYDDFDEKLKKIIICNPAFVTKFFKDDLYSPKSAPLLYDAVNNEGNKLIKHELILLLIFGRPKGWKKIVKDYISKISRNSPYLLDVLNLLYNRCKYDFATPGEISDMGSLLKMCYAKHEFNESNLVDSMKKISNKVIPNRDDELN